jgi:hypothetical protein
MHTWFRIFGTNDAEAEPAVLVELARVLEPSVTAKFSGDDQGWFRAIFTVDPDEPRLILERYLASEEGIRSQIMTWIAWLETRETEPNRDSLMDHLVAVKQLFTLHMEEDGDEASWTSILPEALCQCLARTTNGVYQADGWGFFTASGELMLAEEQHPPSPPTAVGGS